jgi:flagellar assembly protein FliH
MKNVEELMLALRELRGKRQAQEASSGVPAEPAAEERELAAYLRGRQDMEREIQDQLLCQRREFLALEQGVLESLRRVLPQVARDCESALRELCLEMARKLVADLPVTAELVERVVAEALGQVQETTEYHIYLHPEDLALLRRFRSKLVTGETAGRAWHCHAAPDISRGGCVVKTSFGTVDAQRESKLELIKKALLK